MANTIIKVPVPEVGTYTLELYGKGADTLLNSDGADTLTRLTNNKSWATATVTEAVTGVNLARVRNAANDGVGYFFTESMADDTNTYLCVEVDPTTVDAVNTAVALILTSVDVIDGIVDTILIDTNALQTDWADGGRLDLKLDTVINISPMGVF